jgi:hypothetical protein
MVDSSSRNYIPSLERGEARNAAIAKGGEVEEIGKKRLAVAAAIAAGLVYFFVCAQPLNKEYVLAPVWTRALPQAPQSPGAVPTQGVAVHPFKLGDSFGYFDAEGRVLFAESTPYGVALAPDAFALYDRISEGFTIRSPAGADIAKVNSPGYPFFASGRRFLLGPDQCAVSELGPTGAVVWTRYFGSVITAFGASRSLAVFGLMDGTLVGVDATGAESFSFAPGGSRIPGVYGVAVSPDGLLAAAVCGLDKQRLVVLERRATAYRVTYHRWLESDFRRPIAMSFTDDGRRLVYEAPGGAGVYDVGTRKESVIAASAVGRVGASLDESRMLVLLAGAGIERRLVCAVPSDKRIVDLPISASQSFLEVEGCSFFIGANEYLVRLDLKEE